MEKKMCTICGKQVVRMKRHMVSMHKLENGKSTEPANLREFIEMCMLLPVPMNVWSKLMKQHKSELKSFVHDGGELPPSLLYLLHGCYAKYQDDETKLVIKEAPAKKPVVDIQTEDKCI